MHMVKPFVRTGKYVPTIEDIAELSEVDSLPPGGFPLTHRMGEATGMAPGKHVLVVSSAQGDQALYYIENFGVQVTGIDISDYMIATSRRQTLERGLGDRAVFDKGDAQALPYPDAHFDIVVNEGAVAIPARPIDVLSEMVRVAKPGAPICFRESIWTKTLPVKEKNELSEHYGTCPLEVGEWCAILENLGVQDVTCETDPWSTPENFWQVRKDHRVADHENIYSATEKLKVGKKVYDLFGKEGLARVKKNEEVFYTAVRDGKIGYGMFRGIKT